MKVSNSVKQSLVRRGRGESKHSWYVHTLIGTSAIPVTILLDKSATESWNQRSTIIRQWLLHVFICCHLSRWRDKTREESKHSDWAWNRNTWHFSKCCLVRSQRRMLWPCHFPSYQWRLETNILQKLYFLSVTSEQSKHAKNIGSK